MINFIKKLQEKFIEISQTNILFRVDLSGRALADIYVRSFEKEYNPVFRDPTSSDKNCNNCKNFIHRYGNVVTIDPTTFKIVSMFDIADPPVEFEKTTQALSKAIQQSKVVDVFFETFDELNSLPYESCSKKNNLFQLGTAKNVKQYTKEEAEKFGVVQPNEIRTFNHLHVFLDKKFVDTSGQSVETITNSYRDAKSVFQRGMETISLDTLRLVIDLINQRSLLDGTTHLHKIQQILPLKEAFDALPSTKLDNWCWIKSYKFPFAKFRNELIGTLCTELSEGKELNKACESWNKRVDPANYMKAIAPITKRQIDEAQKFVEDNGYTASFNRRFATMGDIKVSEILHSNVNDTLLPVSIFDGVKSTSTRHKRNEFLNVEDVSIDTFMKDILPTCSSVEAFLANKHENHMVSLTTSATPDSKPIFKWNNNYSWTFNGNLAGKSQIKEAVKAHGGKIDGVLRFSITWNEDGKDVLDFDAHALEPNKTEIAFNTFNGTPTPMSGMLDVDMINPRTRGVENIVWSSLSKMRTGKYKFWIRNFNGRDNHGFKAEIEFDGEIYSYEYTNNVSSRKDIHIAEVTLKDGNFSIEHLIPESAVSSREIYGLDTNQFHKVNLICVSPNHWDITNPVGNKYYFFMLQNCVSPQAIRGFHNENLLPELAEHRKVLEVLGATNLIESTTKQLSGLGFNATVSDELIVKLQGTHKRIIKIKF
jgi:hypothetical protein